MRSLIARHHEAICCVALVIMSGAAGCESSAPTSKQSGSPFPAAATYNRENSSNSGMGLTLYEGGSHSKPASTPSTDSNRGPSGTGVPQGNPSGTAPTGPTSFGVPPNYVPGNSPAPVAPGTAPIGYWVYQPAAGQPQPSRSGFTPIIPVYGPPNGPGGVAPQVNGNNPMPPMAYPAPPSMNGPPVPAAANGAMNSALPGVSPPQYYPGFAAPSAGFAPSQPTAVPFASASMPQ